MSSNPAFDPRIVSPLVCATDPDGLARFPSDTLNRVSAALALFAELIANYNGEGELFADDDHRSALALQLDGIAGTLRALSDALPARKFDLKPGEVPVYLNDEEHEKITIVAGRRGMSVVAVAKEILSNWLSDFRPDKPRATN